MNATSPPPDRLHLLVDRYCAAINTVEEAAELETLLRADREAECYFLDHCHLQAQLFQQLATTSAVRDGLQSVLDQHARPARAYRWLNWVRKTVVTNLAASLLVAGLTMTIILLSLALIVPDWERPSPSVGQMEQVRPQVVARVTSTREATWDESSDANFKNIELFADERLVLNSGVAEVTFVDGAVVLLEGPAAFTLNTTGAGKLERGTLSAVVSQQAVGFVVETPILRIVDLGTEFGVESSAGEATTCEVHVFQGSVELQAVGAQGPVGPRRVLRQGQGVSAYGVPVDGVPVDGVPVDGVDAADVVIAESDNSARFVRRLDQEPERTAAQPVFHLTFDQGKMVDQIGGSEGEVKRDIEVTGDRLIVEEGRVVFRDQPSLRSENLTICGWLRVPEPLMKKCSVISKEYANKAPASWGIEILRGRLNFFVITDATGKIKFRDAKADMPTPVGEWFHFACTYEAKTGNIAWFINGRPTTGVIGGIGSGPAVYDGSPLSIGRREGNPLRGFRGQLDDVQIYHQALSWQQIAALSRENRPNSP